LYTEDEVGRQGDSRTLMLDGYTSLHWAVENGDLENVRMLLDHGVNINIAASFDKHSGVTALHLASQVLTRAICLTLYSTVVAFYGSYLLLACQLF